MSLARLTTGPALEIERMILVNVLGLLTLPARQEIAERQFLQAQFRAASETLRIALEARRAYCNTVAASQSVTLLRKAKVSAEAAFELIKRLGETGAVFVTNKLPGHTTIHWHGQRLPNGMDGVGGLTQPHIPVGKTFVYEFELKRSGTFIYHPYTDEMVQMAMGMMGFSSCIRAIPRSCALIAISFFS